MIALVIGGAAVPATMIGLAMRWLGGSAAGETLMSLARGAMPSMLVLVAFAVVLIAAARPPRGTMPATSAHHLGQLDAPSSPPRRWTAWVALALAGALAVLAASLFAPAVSSRATSPTGEWEAVVDHPAALLDELTRVRVVEPGWLRDRTVVELCDWYGVARHALGWRDDDTLVISRAGGAPKVVVDLGAASGDGRARVSILGDRTDFGACR